MNVMNYLHQISICNAVLLIEMMPEKHKYFFMNLINSLLVYCRDLAIGPQCLAFMRQFTVMKINLR